MPVKLACGKRVARCSVPAWTIRLQSSRGRWHQCPHWAGSSSSRFGSAGRRPGGPACWASLLSALPAGTHRRWWRSGHLTLLQLQHTYIEERGGVNTCIVVESMYCFSFYSWQRRIYKLFWNYFQWVKWNHAHSKRDKEACKLYFEDLVAYLPGLWYLSVTVLEAVLFDLEFPKCQRNSTGSGTLAMATKVISVFVGYACFSA